MLDVWPTWSCAGHAPWGQRVVGSLQPYMVKREEDAEGEKQKTKAGETDSERESFGMTETSPVKYRDGVCDLKPQLNNLFPLQPAQPKIYLTYLKMMMKMAMKMSAVSLLLLLLCSSAFSSIDSQESCVYAAVGDSVNVPLGHTLTDTDRLKWTYNNDMILFNRISKTVLIPGNKEAIHENGSLWLKNVKMINNGAYKPEVQDKSGKKIGKELKTTRLCVLERVPKPSVAVECKKNSVIFTCKFAKKYSSDTVAWLKNDKVEAKPKSVWELTKEAKEVQSDSFRCSVTTRLGVMTSDAVTKNCDKGFLKGKIQILGQDIYIWIIVASGGGLVLLLIILVIICCVCTKCKNRRRRQEMRLEWTKEEQHNHQHAQTPLHGHPHHPPPQQQQQPQPAGHTGPRKHRSKRDPQQKPRVPEGHPEPSPRRAAQVPRPAEAVDEEQPPPLPQPRKTGPRAQRV